METLPLHPRLVHLPIALAVLMPFLAGGLLLAWWQGWLAKRAWLVACLMQAILLGSGWLAMRTGESDEDRVEQIVPEGVIEAHEEAAEVFVWTSALVLALALLALVLRGAKVARISGVLTVAGTVAVLLLGYRVGEAGGELVYRHGAAAAFLPGATPDVPGQRNAPARNRAGDRESRRDGDSDDRRDGDRDDHGR